jgi:type IV pilus assembly protein PilO
MTPSSPLARWPGFVKVLLGAGFLSLVGVTYWVGFHADDAARVGAARRRAVELRSELTKLQQEQATYVADRGELELCQQRAREQGRLLPTEAQQASFLSAVQQAANASGIDLKGWSPLEEQPQAFYAKVPMRLEISGRFHQIAKFTWELGRPEVDRRIINVEDIELSDPKVVGDDVIVTGKCLATAFHMLPSAQPASTRPATGAP